MKVINQKLPKLLHLRQPEERKLNKVFIPRYIKRAAISVCLFLCLTSHIAISAPLSINDDETWIFDTVTQKAYDLVLNLQLEEVHLLIPAPETAQQHYVTALAE